MQVSRVHEVHSFHREYDPLNYSLPLTMMRNPSKKAPRCFLSKWAVTRHGDSEMLSVYLVDGFFWNLRTHCCCCCLDWGCQTRTPMWVWLHYNLIWLFVSDMCGCYPVLCEADKLMCGCSRCGAWHEWWRCWRMSQPKWRLDQLNLACRIAFKYTELAGWCHLHVSELVWAKYWYLFTSSTCHLTRSCSTPTGSYDSTVQVLSLKYWHS